jgi:hypothetical protein
LRGLQAGQHAERPVERPAVRHRVEVRAEGDGRKARLSARQRADQVAGGVEADLEARLAHPAGDERGGVRVRRGEGGAGDAAAGVGGDRADLGEAAQPSPEPIAVDDHGRPASSVTVSWTSPKKQAQSPGRQQGIVRIPNT